MNYLEILIAFVSVILLASLMVTTITQMFIASINLRGKNLFWGLQRLLSSLQLEKTEGTITKISESILQHPLISRYEKRLASVIRVEELSHILENYESYLKDFDLSEEAKEWLDNFKGKKEELSQWFDNITDRLSERFALHSRWVSIGAALVVTIVLQLDSIYLLQKISLDDELRSQLVANASLYLQEGEKTLGQKSVFDATMDSLRQEKGLDKLPVAPDFANRVSAESWLKINIQDGQSADSLIDRYNLIYKSVLQKKLNYMGDQLLSLNSNIEQLGLAVFTEKYNWTLSEWGFSKFLGMLISVALLSLGAPFWFKALKSMVNLRSRLMESEEKERGARKKKP